MATKIVAILSGDMQGAGVDHLVLPLGVDLHAAKREHAEWLIKHHAMEHISFADWLKKHYGARDADDCELEVYDDTF